MSLIRFSTILLVFISTQVICYGPDYCEDLTTNGSFSALQIFRQYGENKMESIRLYNREFEFEVELTSNMSLEFKKRIRRHKLDGAWHKYGAYVGYSKGKGLMNCEVSFDILCRTISGKKVIRYVWSKKRDEYRPLFVIPSKPYHLHSYNVLVLDQNDRNRYFAVYPSRRVYEFPAKDPRKYPLGVKLLCDGPHINYTQCRKPLFLQQLNDYYFGKLEGVLDITNGTEFSYLLLFHINGRHKYCFTFGEKLSLECNSSANMKTLFAECIPEVKVKVNDESTDQSMDPFVWVFIVLVIITVILIFAIVWTYSRRSKRKKYRFQLDPSTPS